MTDEIHDLLADIEATLQDTWDLLEIEDVPGGLELMDEIDALLSRIEDLA